jgi:hypothetical protein
MIRRSTALAALLVTLAAAPLAAQERTAPVVGERVRISGPALSPRKWRGELVEVRGDTLVVLREPTMRRVEVPPSAVRRLEVRRPRSRIEGLGHGLLLGVSIGAATGVAAGLVADGDGGCYDWCFAPVVYGIAGAAAGTVLGAIVGVAMPGEKWVAVPRAAPATAGGVAVSVGVKL